MYLLHTVKFVFVICSVAITIITCGYEMRLKPGSLLLFLQGNVKDYQLWVSSKRDNAPYPLIGKITVGEPHTLPQPKSLSGFCLTFMGENTEFRHDFMAAFSLRGLMPGPYCFFAHCISGAVFLLFSVYTFLICAKY